MTVHTIEYKDENGNVVETDIITVVKGRDKMKEIFILQQTLIEALYENINAVTGNTIYSGSLLLDDVVWSNLQKLAKLLPVVGKEKLGINFQKLEEDTPQLIRLFFTQSCDDEGEIKVNSEVGLLPSVLCDLYKFNFPKLLQDLFKKMKAQIAELEKINNQ